MTPGISEGRELHRESPHVELLPEGLRVGDHLPRVDPAELLHLEEHLRSRGDPIPVGVVLDPPEERLHGAVEQVLAVREEQTTLRTGERLVGAGTQHVDALQHGLLKFAARNQTEDMGRVVAEHRSDVVTCAAEPAQVVREQD